MIATRRVDVGEVELHVATAGAGLPVVLLHGFPSYWKTWVKQIEPLVEAGYQVIAPDLRGYNLSDKPQGWRAYTAARLADDVAGLIRAFDHPRVSLVGHDWGALVAWVVAMRHPDLLDRLVVMSVSHPSLTRRELARPARMLKWWYMFFFQLPWLPELAMSRRLSIARCLREIAARPEVFSDEDVQAHLEAFRRPGAATASINYYRAMMRSPGFSSRVDLPTLVLWGDQDPLLGDELLTGLEDVCPNAKVERVAGAGHWPHVECPSEVNRLLLSFLPTRSGA